ncbi:MAG: NAD(P)H-quinone oxidoreductase subunit N [Cyanobacteria bacterium SID2]|nr:NAD(P)H-quinone oxidoreductase subunit N [Cyanobacteria bacterium SID2]MBP0003785.1 NAD(P)H-quinone oxidoreductase subunit N [Cyanobacteria bacterium SBC]
MTLLANGKKFLRDLEQCGALGVYAPLEGGFEGRYQRRVRAAGYVSLSLNARGLGDLAAYLTGVHGVRPPHLGKKDFLEGAAGPVVFVPPIVQTQLDVLPPRSKGLLLWIIDGKVLSRQELEYLTALPKLEPRVKVVVEVGGDRVFRWTSLEEVLVPA